MSVGLNIKKRRLELGMSQDELASAMGYKTRSTISKIESGENDINQAKLQKIAEVLDTSIDYLISGFHFNNTILDNAIIDNYNNNYPNKNIAIILAGGKSSRNHQNIPNQFIDILGKPVIVYTLEAYQKHPAIDDIYIVCLKGWEQIVLTYAKKYNITKLKGLIPASTSGILSVKNGLDYVKKIYSKNDIIIFQEATRPMVSVDMISKLLQSCYENGTANICHPMKDYVQFIYENSSVSYLDRNKIVDLQSPEAYKIEIIDEVFNKAINLKHELSESCCVMLMYNLGYQVNFIESNINNIKIVREEDISVFATLIKNRILY